MAFAGGLALVLSAAAFAEDSSHIPPELTSGTATREDVAALLAGTDAPGERRRILSLNHFTNLDDYPEMEIVLDEQAYAGAAQIIIDVAGDGRPSVTSLHTDAWD